jgi:hypothetical protein
VSHLKIDIHNPSDDSDASFGFAFRTQHGDRFFETYPIKLAKGWNHGVVVPLNKRMFSKIHGRETYRRWQEGRGHVTRVMVQFFEGDKTSNEVIIDNLQSNVRKEGVSLGSLPELLSVEQNVEWLVQHEKFEVTVSGRAPYTDPFNTDDISARMHLVTPSGDHYWISGFLYGFEEWGDAKLPIWKIRFTPTKTGTYSYEVFLRNRRGEAVERGRSFEVFPGNKRGFVRCSPKHPRYFEHSTGEFFYPFGQNVCWASDYEYYFRRINNYGGNFTRIWMCPWNLHLEPKNGLGRYDLDVGKELDGILDLAEAYGIYVQLVFEYHGMLTATWDENPYNKVNGGMCATPEDFFRNGEAKRSFKRRVEYIVNRWGYSPNIMAWELFNEVDISKYAHVNDVYHWHKEMSEYIHDKDFYHHLITTSTAARDGLKKLWELPYIDFTQAHFYDSDVFEEVEANYTAKSEFTKPYFIGEFGRGWKASHDKLDTEGRHLHHVLWMQLMTDSAGNAMPWWWDTYIEPFDLYHMFDSVARFARGIDRRTAHLQPIRLSMTLGENHYVKIAGLQNRNSIYLWFYNSDLVLHPEMSRQGKLLTKEVKVYFKGMMDGRYTVEYWDTYKGIIFNSFELDASNGEFSIKLHETDWDYAVKIERLDTGPPETGIMIEEELEEESSATSLEDPVEDSGETE